MPDILTYVRCFFSPSLQCFSTIGLCFLQVPAQGMSLLLTCAKIPFPAPWRMALCSWVVNVTGSVQCHCAFKMYKPSAYTPLFLRQG